MKAFQPIIFGEYGRYRAICINHRWFVADANIYDRQNKDRATITHTGLLSSLPSMVGLVASISGDCHYKFDNDSGWMETCSEVELIRLYEEYVNSLHSIVTFGEFEYL